jgi:hypothetical protein
MEQITSILANLARSVTTRRTFAVAALVVAYAIATYLFSQGAFDVVVSQVGILSPNQFFALVLIAMTGGFVLVWRIINIGGSPDSSPRIRIIVHDAEGVGKVIPRADVKVFANSETKVSLTDDKGEASFVLSAEDIDTSVPFYAQKDGYEEYNKRQRLKQDKRYFIPLPRVKKKASSMD